VPQRVANRFAAFSPLTSAAQKDADHAFAGGCAIRRLEVVEDNRGDVRAFALRHHDIQRWLFGHFRQTEMHIDAF
jgi:hypothetical protein